MEPPRKIMKTDCISTANGDVTIRAHTYIAPTDHEIAEKDLPLLSNVDVVRVLHYLMKLTTNFALKTINGALILFLEWDSTISPKEIILDACYLQINQVTILRTIEEFDVRQSQLYTSGNRKNFYKSDSDVDWFAPVAEPSRQLQFKVDKWSLSISGWQNSSVELLPSVIRIDYVTLEESPSIHWRACDGFQYADESVRKCLYSPAPPVNNRGLFPCQEPPSALATWEVLMEVENKYTPLLSSDRHGEVVSVTDRTNIHYFYSSIPLPMSTFALVIGEFYMQKVLISCSLNSLERTGKKIEDQRVSYDICKNHIKYPCRFSDPKQSNEEVIPVRLFSLDKDCISALDTENLSAFILSCLETCFKRLGPHPFDRLDLIIMPKCFPHMGLANPSMIFLSPSNFTGADEPLFVCRIPHEICHSWFGLLIGALDWTEEWLSEGFATYCEDLVFGETYNNFFPRKTSEQVRKELALKICLRFITLQNELQNTDNELQVMKPEPDNNQAAKNGLVPIKQFMHVHYYKGYLLLCQLSCFVGQENFSGFLKEYVWRYHGQLVTSDIFLQSYWNKFKETLNANPSFISIEKVKSEWLESDTLPMPYNTLDLLLKTEKVDFNKVPIFAEAADSLVKIKTVFELMKSKQLHEQLDSLSCTEILILLEHVLSIEEDKPALMTCYNQLCCSKRFQAQLQNPEVMHRYCELIILCKDKSKIAIVREFLENNVAMGVYLYGELMISEKLSFQKLAKRVFQKLEKVYDLGTLRILKEMLA